MEHSKVVEHTEVRHISVFEQTLAVEPAFSEQEFFSKLLKQAKTEDSESNCQLIPALFQVIPVPLVIARMTDGIILYANEHYCSTFGLVSEVMNTNQTIEWYYDSVDWQSLLQLLTTQDYLRDHEVKMQLPDGTLIWCHLSLQKLTFQGEQALLGVFGNITKYKEEIQLLQTRIQGNSTGKFLDTENLIPDINERHRLEDALQQAEAKYRSIFENASEGIFQSTSDGYYISANPALARLYGDSNPEELITRLVDIEHQLYVEPQRRAEFMMLLQENDFVCEFESQVYRKDGSVIWISENAHAVRDTNTRELLYYEGTVEDITEQKLAKEQLHQRAFYDVLTKLPNRALFMERLSNAIERAKRQSEYRFALLFLDLDHFKVVNDTLGHLVGDQLLFAIARRLETCVLAEDTVARLGGDEFTILIEDIKDINPAICVAQKIKQELSAAFHLDGHELFAAASIGIVLSPEVSQDKFTSNYDQMEDLLHNADMALYRAKALGKARYEVFNA